MSSVDKIANPPASPLSAGEVVVAARAFSKEVGPEAYLHLSFNVSDRYGRRTAALTLSVYPDGISKQSAFSVSGEDYAEIIETARAKWSEFSDTHAARTVREMALAIIRITADMGECTDAALRQEFDAAKVARFGGRAIADANEIASNGPFEIVSLSAAANEAA